MADQSLGASEPTALEHAIEQLYAVPLADFMTTRAALVAQARAAPNRPLAQQIGKLRKPSVAAALLNALIRARPDLVADLDSVGAQLRAAQASLHGTALGALRPARDELIAGWLAGATDLARAAGSALSAAAETEVRDTVIAALASAEASAAVASGTLVRALSYSGFGEVDLADAVVATTTGRLLRLIRTPEPGDADTPPDPAPEPEPPRPEPTAALAGGLGAGPEAEHVPEPPVTTEPAPAPVVTPEPAPAPAPEPAPEPEPPRPDPTAALEAGPEGGPEARPEAEHVPEPPVTTDPAPPPGDDSSDEGGVSDHDALIAAAALAYQAAAAAVTAAKAAVAESSARLDAAKDEISRLQRDLAAAQARTQALFEQDAQARSAVAEAVKARQVAADLLARRAAAGAGSGS